MKEKENELSHFSKTAVALIFFMAAVSVIVNIKKGIVPDPGSFLIVSVGFILFVIPKLCMIVQKSWVDVGPSSTTESMANLHPLGYWMMMLGILLTFA